MVRKNIRDPYRYLTEGMRIARAFKKEGLTTNQSITVMNLYQRNYLRKELMSETELKNEGQFSRDVIMPLKERGYIVSVENVSPKKVGLTEEGKCLVDKVMKKTGYFLY